MRPACARSRSVHVTSSYAAGSEAGGRGNGNGRLWQPLPTTWGAERTRAESLRHARVLAASGGAGRVSPSRRDSGCDSNHRFFQNKSDVSEISTKLSSERTLIKVQKILYF